MDKTRSVFKSVYSNKFIVILIPVLAVGIGLLASIQPVLFGGIVIVSIFLIFAILRPREFLIFVFATGAISLAFITEKQKPYFAELGGINFDGMRLLGFLFVMLVYLSVRMRSAFKVAVKYKLYWFFLFFAGFSIVYSIGQPVDGLRLMAKIAYPFLLFIIIQIETKDVSFIEVLEKSIYAGGIIVSLIGFLNIFRGQAFIVGIEGITQYNAGLAHPNMMAFFFLVVFVFSFINFLYLHRRIHLFLSLLFLVQLVLTFTRIALVSVIIALIIIVFRKTNPIVALAAALLVAGLGFLAVFNVPALKTRMFIKPEKVTSQSLLNDPEKFVDNIRLSGRNKVWSYALENVFRKNPWFGGGLGSTDIIIGREWQKQGWKVDVTGTVPVHNEYIRMLCEIGILGFLIFLTANLKFFKDMLKFFWKAKGKLQFERISLTALCLIVCYLIISLTSNVINWYSIFSQYVFAFMAMAYKLYEFGKEMSNVSMDKDSL